MTLIRCSIVIASLLLSGCVSMPWGVELDKPEQRTLATPEIDASFQPIPLKVAVYVAPRAAGALNYADFRQMPNVAHPLISYGQMGPALLEAVGEYFPKAFHEASVVNDFPDPALLLEDIEAVVVFESGIGSRSNQAGGMGTGFEQSLLNVGVYTPQGKLLRRYQVVATYKGEFKFETNPYKAHQLAYDNARIGNRSVGRLALHRFPRDIVAAAQQRDREEVDAATLAQRRRALHAAFDAAAPMIAGQPVDGMQVAAQQAGQAKAQTAAFSSQLGMSGLNPSLVAAGQGMSLVLATTASRDPNAPASSTGAFILEFLGGVTAIAQQRQQAINLARASRSGASGSAPASPGTCDELARLANQCRQRQASMGGGTTGQAGSFADCAQMYGDAYRSACDSTASFPPLQPQTGPAAAQRPPPAQHQTGSDRGPGSRVTRPAR
jgi:hypothetical protein